MAKKPEAAPDAVLVEEPDDRNIELIAVQTMAGRYVRRRRS
jgi:hypothetical protein